MEPITNVTTSPLFYYATALGLMLYLVKKYIAGDTWNLHVFIKKDLAGLINSVAITTLIAYLVPEIVLYASDLPKLSAIASKYPSLVAKVTVAFGGVLGFTGGSIGYDLLPLLYQIPVVGPFLKSIAERLRSAKADRVAKARGIDTAP